MKRGQRISILCLVLVLSLVADHVAFAAWDLTAPGDPNRRWGVSLTTGVGYDDNILLTKDNRQSGVRLNSDVKFRATVPLERLFMGAQYDYAINYPEDIHRGGIAQTHNLNASANYAVSPRLGLGLTETYISTLVPGLVLGPNGVPVSIANAGGYIYEAVGGSANYALTPRWTMSANGSWDIWSYEQASKATLYDHEDYAGTLSALYALDAPTIVGVNYQYSQDVFVHPGTNAALNGYSNTGFLSLTHRFNPQLSLTLNAGYTIRDSADGTESTSPSGAGSFLYNYGPSSTISLTVAQALSQSTIGVSRQFSAQQNTSVALQINHRLTVRLHALANVTYNYSSFTAPIFANVTVSPNDQALTAHLGIGYDFRQWLSAVMDYYHTELISSDPRLIPPYSRNQISIGMTVSY